MCILLRSEPSQPQGVGYHEHGTETHGKCAEHGIQFQCKRQMVPVLSSTTVSMLCAVSSASADLIKIPFAAPLPVPTIIAVGVASPNAHGQEMTRTDIPMERANSRPYPAISHEMIV